MRAYPGILRLTLAVAVAAFLGASSPLYGASAAPATLEQPKIAIPPEPTFTIVTNEQINAATLSPPAKLIGDGSTNNTAAFQRLLGNGGRHILVPSGDYVIDSLRIPPNTILELAPGTIIRDSGRRSPGAPLFSIRNDGIQILGHGALLLGDRNAYPNGTYQHGVSIIGAHRVILDSIASNGNAGDGFYVGGGELAAEDIVLRGCHADKNKRQGLSITSARRVYVVDSEFMNTSGAPPDAGIDLEPNRPTDLLDQITIVRAKTMNNSGGGIRIELSGMKTTSKPPIVTILGHASKGEQPPYQLRNIHGVPITVSYQAAGAR